MSNQIYSDNVNWARTENSEGLVPGRGSVCERADLGCQCNTARPDLNNKNRRTTRKRKNRKWSKEENMFITE